MGITIIQKSDLSFPKTNPRIALVLAGGAISGAAFKLGGLAALNRFMKNRKIVDFDMYVGTSAGSVISAFLANGIPVTEITNSLEGRRGMLDPMRASDFYAFNYLDFFKQPVHLCYDAMTFFPATIFEFFWNNNLLRIEFRKRVFRFIREPNYENLSSLTAYCFGRNGKRRKGGSIPWHYIPTGMFTTGQMERAIRKNIENNHLSNNFRELYEKRGKELLISAMNLDTAKRSVFAWDGIDSVPISKAVEASIAIPIFYKPVNIDGVDYVDGAMVQTTSIDLAINKGADLVICYNPFRPFNHSSYLQFCGEDGERCHIAQDGIYAVFNQVIRTLVHTRLLQGLELRKNNPDFKGDVILVEPTEYDDKFFDMNPLAFWERRKAAKRGFESVKQSIGNRFIDLERILNSYGIEVNTDFSGKATLN